MRIESLEYAYGESVENNSLDDFGKSLDLFTEGMKAYEIAEANVEKFFEQFEKIQWAMLPILAKSAKGGLKLYNDFGELARKTNYSAQDTNGRSVIMLSDTFTTLLTRALIDTKEYLLDIKNKSL